jgi:hypothetical protein
MVDFEHATDRVIAGMEKKNKVVSAHRRNTVAAYREGWPRGATTLTCLSQVTLPPLFFSRSAACIIIICSSIGFVQSRDCGHGEEEQVVKALHERNTVAYHEAGHAVRDHTLVPSCGYRAEPLSSGLGP